MQQDNVVTDILGLSLHKALGTEALFSLVMRQSAYIHVGH